MKKSFLTPMLAWGLLVLVLLPGRAPAGTITWATDDTPGGHYIIGDGPNFHPARPGIEIELYRMVAKKLGLDLILKRFSWNQCLHLIQTNKVDGIFPASFKPQRLEMGVFPMAGGKVDETRKTRNNAYFLYQLKKGPLSWKGGGFSADRPVTIGVPAGWGIEDVAEKMFGAVLKESISRKTPNLLIHRRLDGFICLETVFDAYLAEKKAYGEIEKLEPAVWKNPYYLMLSRQFCTSRPQLAEQIWDAIRDIKATQTYRDLVKTYLDNEDG